MAKITITGTDAKVSTVRQLISFMVKKGDLKIIESKEKGIDELKREKPEPIVTGKQILE